MVSVEIEVVDAPLDYNLLVRHRVRPHGIEILHDVYIVMNHSKRLKAKALPLIDVLCIGDQG